MANLSTLGQLWDSISAVQVVIRELSKLIRWTLLSSKMRRSRLPSKFLQSQHLQFSLQYMPAWKHSQYFLRQPLFLQAQPLACLPWAPPSKAYPLRAVLIAATAMFYIYTDEIFGRKAFGFRSRIVYIVSFRACSFSMLLLQFIQLQFLQYSPEAKHSQ